jgi:TonB family protein
LLVITLGVPAFSQTEQASPSTNIGASGEIGGGIGGGGSGIGPDEGLRVYLSGTGPGASLRVYHVGGGVLAPKVVYRVDPKFSKEARKNKREGTVRLRVIVGVDGRTRDIRVVQSLGMGLDENAIKAASLWRFEPATKNGEPVPVEVTMEVNFHFYQRPL